MDLEDTVARITPDLLRYCAGAAGNAETGEEIAQEALTVLVSHWRRKGRPDSPEALVYTVARRIARRWRWRNRLFRRVDSAMGAYDTTPIPEEVARWRSELGRVRAVLQRLPARHREALLLAAASGLDTGQAARLLGISRSAFKMRLHRGRRRLIELMEIDDARSRRRATEGAAVRAR